MAKQVSEILIKLGLQGVEGLDKLKGAFRELEKSIGPNNAAIERARQSIIDYGRDSRNTEQVIKGQIDALRGLQSQVERGSSTWAQLATDIEQFRQASRRTDSELETLRQGILAVSSGTNQSQASLRAYIADLGKLRSEASLTGRTFTDLGQDIAQLTGRLQQAEAQTVQTSRAFGRVLGQALASTSAGARQQLQSLKLLIAGQREVIDSIDTLDKRERRLTHNMEARADAQDRLNRSLAQQRQLTYQESIRSGREGVRAGAAAFADPDFLRTLTPEALNRRLGELPDTTAGLSQGLTELSERLANTTRNSVDYLTVAMQMAGAQRELTAVTQGYAQALLMGIRTGIVAPSARNLQEAATALRAEMAQLDTTTTEGARAYADNAREANSLERRLRALANAYRNVGDMATQAATAEQNAANARIRDNYFNRGMVRQQEAALAELGQRVRTGVSGTPLLLPAAGQTSAPGTGLNVSGGARTGRRASVTYQIPGAEGIVPAYGVQPGGGVERFFGRGEPGAANAPGRGVTPIGPGMTPEQEGKNRTRVIAEVSQAYDALGKAVERSRRPLRDIYVDIDKTTKASNGSVNSLEAQIGVWTELRNAVGRTAPAFDTATKKLEQLTAQRERLTGGRRLSGMQLAQGVGAALSGGIFGGPEGLIGGLGGLALGGVGGAFAGAAAGAQVGMFRQQIAGTADYAAQIGKLQIALRGIVGSQQAYDQAVQAAASATRDLNIPQQEATQGITRLSAAVLGAGGTVTDSAFAFRAMSEAVKATGGGAEQVDGALLALTQVFSKGKVSAEELNQIAERLPGTFTLFAQAAGKTGPELQKALEQGQIGLNDLMKFLTAVRDRYSSTALTVAGSSEEAGARLKIAFDEMRLEVGKALKSTGSDLQVAFAAFVKEITPAVVGAAKGLAASLKLITDNAATFKTLLEFAAALGTATLAINTFKAAATGIAALNIAGTLTTTAGAVKLTGDVMGVTAAKTGLLTGALTSLRVATVALATAWAAPLALTVAIVGGVATYNWIQKLKKATDDLKASTMQRTGESWLSGIGGTAASNAVVNRETSSQLMRVSSLQEKLAALNKERTALRPLAKNILSPDIAQNAQVELAAVEQRIKTTRLDLYAARRNAEVGLAEIAKRQRQGAGRGLTGLTQFAAPAEDKSADKAAKAQESLMRKLQSDFDSTITQLGRRFNAAAKDKLYETLLGYENKIQRAYRQNNLVLAEDLKLKQKAAALDITEEVLLSEKASLQQKLAEARTKGLDAQAVQNRLDTVNAELKQINYDSTKETTTQLEKQATLATQIKDALTQAFAPTSGGPGGLLASGVVGGVFPGAFTGEEESFKSLTDQRGIERIKELGKELQALTNPLSQILTAAEAIGSAFSSSFTSVISGTASTQEALASFFNNIANYFLDMAGKIIAKWIEMAILNTVLQLLPSGPKFGSSAAVPGLPGLTGAGALSGGTSIAGTTDWASQGGGLFSKFKMNALGNAYAANGIVPFAMGGIVNKPTLFRFANGGVPGTGLMGEAGPEAIMPLKRGPDGKLGVSGGGSTTNVTVNVDAQGTQAQGDDARGQQLGRVIAAAVQAELVKQKRPGGLLA